MPTFGLDKAAAVSLGLITVVISITLNYRNFEPRIFIHISCSNTGESAVYYRNSDKLVLSESLLNQLPGSGETITQVYRIPRGASKIIRFDPIPLTENQPIHFTIHRIDFKGSRFAKLTKLRPTAKGSNNLHFDVENGVIKGFIQPETSDPQIFLEINQDHFVNEWRRTVFFKAIIQGAVSFLIALIGITLLRAGRTQSVS